MFYIAADCDLPEVAWNPHQPGFHVQALLPDDVGVRAQFTLAQVVYAGSHEGCGCGFGFDWADDCFGTDEQDRLERTRTQTELIAYLQRVLELDDPIELFACWDGDQSEPRLHARTLELAQVCAPLQMQERERVTIVQRTG